MTSYRLVFVEILSLILAQDDQGRTAAHKALEKNGNNNNGVATFNICGKIEKFEKLHRNVVSKNEIIEKNI